MPIDQEKNALTLLVERVCTPDGGMTINCEGRETSGVLVTVFGKVVAQSSPTDAHEHPWDHLQSNPPTQGTVNRPNWRITGIPTNGLTTGRLLVWGIHDGENYFELANGCPFDFTLGSGSGSGATVGACPQADFAAYTARQVPPRQPAHRRGPFPDAMPRVYKMTVDVRTLDLKGLGLYYLADGLLCSGAGYLTYEPGASTATSFVWRGQNLGNATGVWTLRVNCHGPTRRATLTYQTLNRLTVSRPKIWRKTGWVFHTANTLRTVHTKPKVRYPDVRVEPA